MDAKNGVKKSVAQRLPPVPAHKHDSSDGGGEPSTDLPTSSGKTVANSESGKGSRKRPRDNDKDSSAAASVSMPQSSSKHSESVADAPANKKIRLDWTTDAEFIVRKMCLNRLERVQIQTGKFQTLKTAQDLHHKSLKTILHQLKTFSPEAYIRHLEVVRIAYESWIEALKMDRAIEDAAHNVAKFQAKQEIIDAVLACFDCESLIKLYPLLTGNSQLQMILRYLDLPLHDLRKLAAGLRCVREKIGAEQERLSALDEILKWLSPPEPYPSLPDEYSYNDLLARGRYETAMNAQIDHGSLLQQDAEVLRKHCGRGSHLRGDTTVDTAYLKELQSQAQATSDNPSTHVSSSIHNRPHSPPMEAPSAPSAIVTSPPSATSAVAVNSTEMIEYQPCGPKWTAALAEARAKPRRQANADTALRHEAKLARYTKLQTRGEAYKILIQQLIDAENGGPPPLHLKDLQMPDADACYYRLQDLWDKMGTLLWQYSHFEYLLTDMDRFYGFAICVREAHCLLRVVNHHGFTYEDVLATGWDLNKVRHLQSMMVNHAHDEPFIWSKPDVDAICTALHEASKRKASAEKAIPVSFAATVASTQATVPHNTGAPNDGSRQAHQQHSGNDINPPYVLQILEQEPQGVDVLGQTAHQMPTSIPIVQIIDPDDGVDGVDAMDTDNTPIAARAQGLIFCAPNGDVVDHKNKVNFCRNWEFGRCKNRRCPRLHFHFQAICDTPYGASSGAQIISAPEGSQLNQQSFNAQQAATPQAQAGRSSLPCRFFAAGTCRNPDDCRWSHDPVVFAAHNLVSAGTQQPIGDATMEEATFNGDNQVASAAVSRPNNKSTRCKYEKNGRSCTRATYHFRHEDARSRNFSGDGQEPSLLGQGQQVNSHQPLQAAPQDRAPNNFTYDSNIHGAPILQQQQQQQQQPVQTPQTQVVRWLNNQGGNNNVLNQGPQCYNCKEYGHISTRCTLPQINNTGGNRHGGNQRGGNQQGNNQRGSVQRSNNQQGRNQQFGNQRGGQRGPGGPHTGNTANKTCFKCNLPGHISRDCPLGGGQSGRQGGGQGGQGVGQLAWESGGFAGAYAQSVSGSNYL